MIELINEKRCKWGLDVSLVKLPMKSYQIFAISASSLTVACLAIGALPPGRAPFAEVAKRVHSGN